MRILSFQVILILASSCSFALADTATLKPQVESKALKNHNWYSSQSKIPNAGVATARDSYSDAASDMGYNMDSYSGNQITGGPQTTGQNGGSNKDHLGQGLTYHYKIYPGSYPSYGNQIPEYASSYNGYKGNVRQDVWDNDDEAEGADGGGIGGLAGLIGLLGLKGFKGFKLWKLLQLAPILLPLFLPILLPILLLGLVALLIPLGLLLLIPVPIITIPSGRSLINQGATLARDLIMNEDCVERISCEVSRYARGYGFNPTWVQKLAEKNSTNKWIDRISRSVQNANCSTYTCNPIEKLQKSLKLKN